MTQTGKQFRAANIGKLQKQLGWNDQQFADRTGLHSANFSKWRHDKSIPTRPTISRIAALAGCEDRLSVFDSPLSDFEIELLADRILMPSEAAPDDRKAIDIPRVSAPAVASVTQKAAEQKPDSPRAQTELFSLVSQSHAVRDEVEKALGGPGGMRIRVEIIVPEELTALINRLGYR